MKAFLTLAFLLTSLQQGFAQNYNLGFEQWDTAGMGPTQNLGSGCTTPANAQQTQLTSINFWTAGSGVWRTTDAHSGNYAAVVSIWYLHATGRLLLGQCGHVPGVDPPCKNKLPFQLHGISGYYKYTVDSLDPVDGINRKTMTYIQTFKTDPVTQHSTLLTFDSFAFVRTNTYQPFQVPVHYASGSALPDSVSIWFESQNNGSGGGSCTNNHLLYVDDLVLHNTPIVPAGVPESLFQKVIRMYPNPATETLTLEYENDLRIHAIQLMDVSGRIVRNQPPAEKTISVAGLPSGYYLLRMVTHKGVYLEKVSVK